MIAFGSSIADGEAYRRYAAPGVRRVAEPDSPILNFAAVAPAGRGFNLILDAAARLEELEALVLVSPYTEIIAPRFCATVRDALSDPAVAILGACGANGVRSLAWWEGDVVSAPVVHRYQEHMGGELPGLAWRTSAPPPAEVEVLDGQLLVLSPWAVRNLRFDEGLVLTHGIDLDLCLSARTAGRRLLVADLPVVHNVSIEIVGNVEIWTEAHIALARKWGHQLDRQPEPEDDAAWKERARRAEARREAARAVAFSLKQRGDAEVDELGRALREKTDTRSWQLTRPLRELNAWRRERARD